MSQVEAGAEVVKLQPTLGRQAFGASRLAGNAQALEDMIRSASESRAAWQISGKK